MKFYARIEKDGKRHTYRLDVPDDGDAQEQLIAMLAEIQTEFVPKPEKPTTRPAPRAPLSSPAGQAPSGGAK